MSSVATLAFHSRAPSMCTGRSMLARDVANRLQLGERGDLAARAVMGVLDADQARRRRVRRRRPDRARAVPSASHHESRAAHRRTCTPQSAASPAISQ